MKNKRIMSSIQFSTSKENANHSAGKSQENTKISINPIILNENLKSDTAQTVNVVNTVRIQRTKCVDKIINFFHLDERNSKDECTREQRCIYFLIIWILFVMLIISLSGLFIVYFTNYYESQLQANLVLANGTKAKQWWEKTPIYPLMKIYVFNYTNAEEYLKGQDNILKLQQIGPLVYKQMTERIDLEHHEDDTISYNEKKHYEFMPELTDVSPQSTIVVPNIPFIIADHKVGQLSYWNKFSSKVLIRATTPTMFKALNVTDFLWGYDDPIIDLYKVQSYFQAFVGDKTLKIDKFGILSTKNGTSPEKYTIYTGMSDIKKLGVVKQMNGQSQLDYYSEDECNSIDGTDGSQFPPNLMDKKSTLHIFLKALCRKFPLRYEKEVTVFESRIPAWRYKPPEDVFSHPNENPSNHCYCNASSNACPPSGVFNVSRCLDGLPLLSSFPHFYLGDPKLYQNFEGLQPKQELHETYADIHSKLAFPLNGVSRFQINIELSAKPEFDQFYPLHDTKNNPNRHTYKLLPLIWMEVTGGEIPKTFQEIIYESTFTVNVFESHIKYGTVIIVVLSVLLLMIVLIWTQRLRSLPEPIVTYIHEPVNVS